MLRRRIRFATYLAPNMFAVYGFITRYIGDKLGCLTELVVGSSYDRLIEDAEVAFVCDVAWSVCMLACPARASEEDADLSPCERACLDFLEDRKEPMTGEAIWNALTLERSCSYSLSTVKRALASLKDSKKLSNSRDRKGYFLMTARPVIRLAARA